MIHALKRFKNESLFDATSHFLEKLNVKFTPITAEPIDVTGFYDGPLPLYLTDALENISDTYFIGVANDASLLSENFNESIDSTSSGESKYNGMFIFACDTLKGKTISRSSVSALTRALNRVADRNPVILIIRQEDDITLATCERMNYAQDWMRGKGEKLGKVNMLRNISCSNPHPGHVQTLELLYSKKYANFEELYTYWMEVFSCELLTKKFYNELSTWYAWAVQSIKFPNNIYLSEDDDKYNHEACIRLITRLIFVWFLKQKHLIPEEFFDEKYISENLIENFAPNNKHNLNYDPNKSKYYRLILQNLFFATLNCPIQVEGKSSNNNRRFCKEGNELNEPTNVMRYKSEFKERGSEKFVRLANSCVPFLNGGLFDCLDNSGTGLFYDGFSENKQSLEQLSVPDYLFFGDNEGTSVDLSKWFDDKKKKAVKTRGIINILKNYSFTIEENTPYDQEVSLDPELLGKVFENLLASYNPETKQSARKQTGSFYTPREIVQYMVDESLIAHLNRMCGKEMEPQYRLLLSYDSDEVNLTDEQRKSIMSALYNCRVLDPACGSGAFPMGVLQQMVHILKRIDPSNALWNSMMVEIAINDARNELQRMASCNENERAIIEENHNARLEDIKNAFNQDRNYPDYARKLYLIEHCIYGVDIQPIATQISKLRFFISLVVDQRRKEDASANFGIRPLPNLDAKFVTANTLIPLDRSKNLYTNTEEICSYEEQLQEINHRIFLAKKNSIKKDLKNLMYSVRAAMAQTMENMGAIGSNGYNQLMGWDMFDQNASASFFDPEWMFGIKDGFDIVIGNPPYISIRTKSFDTSIKATYKKLYDLAVGQYDLYTLFIEKGSKILKDKGILSYIIPTRMLSNENFMPARKFVINELPIFKYVNALMPFENANVEANIMICSKGEKISSVESREFDINKRTFEFIANIPYSYIEQMPFSIFPFVYNTSTLDLLEVILNHPRKPLSMYMDITRGFECGYNDSCIGTGTYDLIKAEAINKYIISKDNILKCNPDFNNTSTYKTLSVFTQQPKFVTKFCASEIQFALDDQGYLNTNSVYNCNLNNLGAKNMHFLLAVLNSKITTFWFNTAFMNIDALFPHIQKNQLEAIPIPEVSEEVQSVLKKKVEEFLANEEQSLLKDIDMILYKIYNLTYENILSIDPDPVFTKEEYHALEYDISSK